VLAAEIEGAAALGRLVDPPVGVGETVPDCRLQAARKRNNKMITGRSLKERRGFIVAPFVAAEMSSENSHNYYCITEVEAQ
jgi:hypothetical protein